MLRADVGFLLAAPTPVDAAVGALALSRAASSELMFSRPSTTTMLSIGFGVRTARGEACGKGDIADGAGLPELVRMCPGRPALLSEPVESVLAIARLASVGAAAAAGVIAACFFEALDGVRCLPGVETGVAIRP